MATMVQPRPEPLDQRTGSSSAGWSKAGVVPVDVHEGDMRGSFSIHHIEQ
ncbi:hypothetical protein RRX38_23615 [Pseudomonas sp. DTU_2021_1001937_2_SI_NGA_ILE_001]|nr:hypothetical protein [Pseudomonas sp. DTU_2021_1001937_2_SI_NGA_ILE_001]WNW14012.1 hypothetical protein RRX38_23615 [Pseudomonas sp. DTU_2021_1001937_2_SI_NGA_ILE_001]